MYEPSHINLYIGASTLIFKRVKFIYLKQKKSNIFHSTIKKDSEANGSSNLQIIIT